MESVAMSLEEKSAEVMLTNEVEEGVLKAAVEEAGYEVVEIR